MSGIIAQNSGRHTGLMKAPSGGGTWTKISSVTASSSSSISFTSGIDSTYKEYVFTFNNLHPSADQPHFTFQGSTNGGSSYGVTTTSTVFNAYYAESDSEYALSYNNGGDLAQSTSYQRLFSETNNANDGCLAGYLHLFEPSSTSHVKNFLAISQGMFGPTGNPYSWNQFVGGYFNITSAIGAVDFKFGSGNIDSGSMAMFGVT